MRKVGRRGKQTREAKRSKRQDKKTSNGKCFQTRARCKEAVEMRKEIERERDKDFVASNYLSGQT